MSHSEPAIKHAALALSSLHRYYEFEQLPDSARERRSAHLYYSRAVSQLQCLLSKNARDNIEKLLVICLLFICYENLVGGSPAAQMHLQHGLCILSEFREPSSSGQSISHRAIPDDILHTISRIDLQAMTFSESRAPYPFSTARRSAPGPIPFPFSSIDEAQYHLFEKFKWEWLEKERLFDPGVKFPPLPQSWQGSQLTTWENSFAALQLRQRRGPPIAGMENALVMTQIYHEMFMISLEIGFPREENSCDAYYAKFEHMLTLIDSLPVLSDSGLVTIGEPGSQKTVTFEWGVILPLYFITTNCRDPHLRRKALARLYALNRREGTWDSRGAAHVAERVIEIEEEGLENVQVAEDVTNEKRVVDTYVVVDMEQRIVHLTCTSKPDSDGRLETRSDRISF